MCSVAKEYQSLSYTSGKISYTRFLKSDQCTSVLRKKTQHLMTLYTYEKTINLRTELIIRFYILITTCILLEKRDFVSL